MEIEEMIENFDKIIISLEGLDCDKSKIEEIKKRCVKIREKLNLIINI